MSAEDAVSFQFLAENSTDVICRAGADTVLHYVSPSSFRILGWKPEEMIGKRPDDFIFDEDRSFLPDSLIAGLDGSAVRMLKKDGTTAWIEIRHHAACDSPTGEPGEKVVVMRDITERKHLQDQLSVLEFTDSRTGLSTHRAFDEALEREWNRTLREGSEISLLLLDFDHFRQFHDWRHHREGDRCLGEAATAVIGALRITDFAARYGAEDIAVILPSTDSGGAVKVAEKVQSAAQALRSPAAGSGKCEGRLMLSMGVATVSARPGATARMPELLRLAADHALQKAKRVRIKKTPARVTAQEQGEPTGKP
jgi:diguanylate cyclase (GGDEF)-like protein/PAS domain S-box-containing protein